MDGKIQLEKYPKNARVIEYSTKQQASITIVIYVD